MRRALACSSLLFALTLPAVHIAVATAADTPRQGATRALARFEVNGPTGYSAFVEASGRQVRLTVHHALSFTRYWVRGFTSTRRVKAEGLVASSSRWSCGSGKGYISRALTPRPLLSIACPA